MRRPLTGSTFFLAALIMLGAAGDGIAIPLTPFRSQAQAQRYCSSLVRMSLCFS